MVSKPRSLLKATERALVAEATEADRPSDAMASFTLVVKTTSIRKICLDIQIQRVTWTCLLDTSLEVSLFLAGLVLLGPRYGR